MESILDSVKKAMGLPTEYTPFDVDIIMHINTVFGILQQIGVTENSFMISDNTATWDDYLTEFPDLNMVKSYVYAKVRMIFDPPASGSVSTALENAISELEWRISVSVDPKE